MYMHIHAHVLNQIPRTNDGPAPGGLLPSCLHVSCARTHAIHLHMHQDGVQVGAIIPVDGPACVSRLVVIVCGRTNARSASAQVVTFIVRISCEPVRLVRLWPAQSLDVRHAKDEGAGWGDVAILMAQKRRLFQIATEQTQSQRKKGYHLNIQYITIPRHSVLQYQLPRQLPYYSF